MGEMDRSATTLMLESTVPATSTGPIVEVSGIARRFGDRWALRGISLRVEGGEAVALLGHNGSGETAVLRILPTALRPTYGAGRVLGYDLLRERAEIRGGIGVLGHAPGLYGDLTAYENLSFASRMASLGQVDHLIESALERVSLERERDELVRGFSAGMQRRLALARILLLRPELLLLDEPYASFDASGIELINDFLLEHLEGGGTAVVSTHDLEKGRGVLDRVVELDRGKVVVSEGII